MSGPQPLARDAVERIIAMSDGNPGAARVLTTLHRDHPESAAAVMARFDELEMRGPAIWFAYRYVCCQDLPRLVASILGEDGSQIAGWIADHRARFGSLP